MKLRGKVALWLGAASLVAFSGCSTMEKVRMPRSRSYEMAQQYRAENERMENQLAQSNARLAALAKKAEMAELEAKKAQLAMAEAKRNQTAKTAESKTPDSRERIAKLVQLTGGTPIVTPDGQSGVRLAGDILFRSGKTTVSGGKDSLRRIADAIKSFGDDVIVYVDGHTDSDPLVRTKHLYKDNYGLGAARASAVAKELQAMGIPAERLIPRSFGQDKPITPNTTRAAKSKNRRVELMFAIRDGGAVATKASMNR
jgi:chemotaxis protein MotB